MAGKVDTKGLKDFAKKLERLNNQQRNDFFNECAKELAARLLRKVVKRTPVGDYSGNSYTCATGLSHKGSKANRTGGTLRRGWTGGVSKNAAAYANSLNVQQTGNIYTVELINPTEYASYVEYGHRTRNHKGWVRGHKMLQISVDELNTIAPKVLEQRLNKKLREVFG